MHRGEATATVTATGSHTFFGRTAELVRTARSAGHLEQLLLAVVRHLVAVSAVLAALLIAGALWRGEALLPLVPFLLVLVTATVPVTMPAAFTVSNAVEARSLAKEGGSSPGRHDIFEVVAGGRRVYRRMLTWTITKIARTVELAALLTLAYLITGIFVTPLFLIVLIIVMNDLVTITVATDRASVSPVPERWNTGEIAKVAGVLAVGWPALAFAILWAALHLLAMPIPQVQTLMFVYLIYSAQATIYLTRVRDRVWSLAPSRYVAATTIGNVIVASALGYWGILVAAVPAAVLVGTLGAVIVAALLLNEVKIWISRSTGILGGSLTKSNPRPSP